MCLIIECNVYGESPLERQLWDAVQGTVDKVTQVTREQRELLRKAISETNLEAP